MSSPLRHGFPVGTSASLSPVSFSAGQISFPAHHSIKHSRLGDPFSIKNVIKFSVGFEGGRKGNNSQDRKLLKINHKKMRNVTE